jgi:hypothetical protein
MPTETRRITFSSAELVQALSRHRRDEKQPLPESRIRGSKVETAEGPVPASPWCSIRPVAMARPPWSFARLKSRSR